MKMLSELRSEDYALMAISPAAAPRFLVCAGMEPDARIDDWLLYDGRDSPESALAHARRRPTRNGVAFTVERMAVAHAPWPTVVPDLLSAYRLERNGFVLLVPFPTPPSQWDPTEAFLKVRVAGATPCEESARAFLSALSCRALLGRIHALVDLDMGFEMPAIEKQESRQK